MRNPIIAALDLQSPDKAFELAARIAQHVGAFKIGSELFTRGGPEIVRRVRATGASVFLDLKFHDIPNTVAKAVESATRLDVQMITIHTCGGFAMMQAAEQSAQRTALELGRPAPLVLGVTVLTSMDAQALDEVGVKTSIGAQVERMAQLAARAGLRGLVCSPLEITMLRQIVPALQLVTPGIRGPGDAVGDQKRTLSAAEAVEAGADWLVIGRPIYAAADPVAAAASILDSLQGGSKTPH